MSTYDKNHCNIKKKKKGKKGKKKSFLNVYNGKIKEIIPFQKKLSIVHSTRIPYFLIKYPLKIHCIKNDWEKEAELLTFSAMSSYDLL